MTPPVFAHGHLRLYLLSLLSESDTGMHGYELIQALGDRFGGTYVPSAGTIYPRLAKLEEDGLVSKVADGRKTVYEITDAGRAELAARAHELDDIESDVTDSVRRLANEVRSSVINAMRTLRADLASAAREAKTEARSASRTTRPDQSDTADSSSRNQVQQAEAVINDFRSALRSQLHSHVGHGGELSVETVQLLRTALDEARRTVTESLG